LERIAPAWRELLARAPAPSTFQTFEWNAEWFAAFGDGELQLWTERADGSIEAILPLYARGDGRTVLIGTGNSDSLEAVAAPQYDLQALVYRAVGEAHRQAQIVDLERVPADSRLLAADAGMSVDDRRVPADPCPVVSLPESESAVNASLAGEFRRSLLQSQRRAERIGALTFQLAGGDAAQHVLDELFALHGRRWAERGERGVLSDPAVQQFHRRVAARLDKSGQLRLLRVCIGSDVAAVYYGFQTGRHAAAYLGGFNPRYASVSPGTLAIREAIHCAIEDGANCLDFLTGREAYKYAWGAVDRPHFTRLLAPTPTPPH
jgi:CelD/BcsL family acetyltransferase involved in cellulose biosynthesis